MAETTSEIGKIRRFRARHPYAYEALRNTVLVGGTFGALGLSGALRLRKGGKLLREVTRVVGPTPGIEAAWRGAFGSKLMFRGMEARKGSGVVVVAPRAGWRGEVARLTRSGRKRRKWAILAGVPLGVAGVAGPAERWGFERRQLKEARRRAG